METVYTGHDMQAALLAGAALGAIVTALLAYIASTWRHAARTLRASRADVATGYDDDYTDKELLP